MLINFFHFEKKKKEKNMENREKAKKKFATKEFFVSK